MEVLLNTHNYGKNKNILTVTLTHENRDLSIYTNSFISCYLISDMVCPPGYGKNELHPDVQKCTVYFEEQYKSFPWSHLEHKEQISGI